MQEKYNRETSKEFYLENETEETGKLNLKIFRGVRQASRFFKQ